MDSVVNREIGEGVSGSAGLKSIGELTFALPEHVTGDRSHSLHGDWFIHRPGIVHPDHRRLALGDQIPFRFKPDVGNTAIILKRWRFPDIVFTGNPGQGRLKFGLGNNHRIGLLPLRLNTIQPDYRFATGTGCGHIIIPVTRQHPRDQPVSGPKRIFTRQCEYLLPRPGVSARKFNFCRFDYRHPVLVVNKLDIDPDILNRGNFRENVIVHRLVPRAVGPRHRVNSNHHQIVVLNHNHRLDAVAFGQPVIASLQYGGQYLAIPLVNPIVNGWHLNDHLPLAGEQHLTRECLSGEVVTLRVERKIDHSIMLLGRNHPEFGRLTLNHRLCHRFNGDDSS